MVDELVTAAELREALSVSRDDTGRLVAVVAEGWDVFSTPHGGYLAALVASAVLTESGATDLFTISLHYLRPAEVGPLTMAVHQVGGSRRFTSWHVTARQRDRPVITAIASVGDRGEVTGASWTDHTPWRPTDATLAPPAGEGSAEDAHRSPAISQRFGQQLDVATTGFATGRTGSAAAVRSRIATDEPDQLAALIACDITPPAVWNAIGARGWVPTLELTAHIRARPAPGPLSIVAETHHLHDGMLEEDAVVHDAAGRIVAQSRQLALAPTAS